MIHKYMRYSVARERKKGKIFADGWPFRRKEWPDTDVKSWYDLEPYRVLYHDRKDQKYIWCRNTLRMKLEVGGV